VTGTDAVRRRRILERFLLAEITVLSLPAAPRTDQGHVLTVGRLQTLAVCSCQHSEDPIIPEIYTFRVYSRSQTLP